MVPAQPPLPTIWKRSFHSVGSFTANFASGQMVPRISQCSGKASVFATSFADSIFTSGPNDIGARSWQFTTGAAAMQAGRREVRKKAFKLAIIARDHIIRRQSRDCKDRYRNAAMRYFVTFTCYGAHLHGEETGSVDRNHNVFGNRLTEA